MESKREQALVGLFVLVAGGVLVATVFALTGAFGGTAATYRAYFPFAGGYDSTKSDTLCRFNGSYKIK